MADNWKLGDEFLPFHPDASHVPPDYRDGWNACYRESIKAALSKGYVPVTVPAGFQREFTNELGNRIRITIEGPTSTSENVLTPMEVNELRQALDTHGVLGAVKGGWPWLT